MEKFWPARGVKVGRAVMRIIARRRVELWLVQLVTVRSTKPDTSETHGGQSGGTLKRTRGACVRVPVPMRVCVCVSALLKLSCHGQDGHFDHFVFAGVEKRRI